MFKTIDGYGGAKIKIQFDAELKDIVDANTWRVLKGGYVVRGIRITRVGMRKLYLHHEVLPKRKGWMVDHRSGDTLDNRRSNLRYVTPQQNTFNRVSRRGSSQFKGVFLKKSDGLWWAKITKDKKQYYLGRYTSEKEAAKAYNRAAKKFFGRHARLNQVPYGN